MDSRDADDACSLSPKTCLVSLRCPERDLVPKACLPLILLLFSYMRSALGHQALVTNQKTWTIAIAGMAVSLDHLTANRQGHLNQRTLTNIVLGGLASRGGTAWA